MSQTPEPSDEQQEKRRRGNLYALEICFLTVVGLIVVLAFFEATTYAIVSSRTPFVIMVPLIVLIAVHAIRLWAARHEFNPRARISEALSGATPEFNKVLGICGLMVGVIFAIWILGHYAGVFLFCLILMRLADEKWLLSAIVAAGATLFIYGVFEALFEIRMYRGLIIRYFLGFRDFDFLRDIE